MPNLSEFLLFISFFPDLDNFRDLDNFSNFLANFSLLLTPNLTTLISPFFTLDLNTLGKLFLTLS